jgi:twinkle protein
MKVSKFVGHRACPSCNSSDAFATYSVGSAHCFSCGYTQKWGVDTVTTENDKPIVVYGELRDPNSHRGISAATLKLYGVKAQGKKIFFPNYSTKDQSLQGYQYRDYAKDKKEAGHFMMIGNPTRSFFGTKSSNNKRLLITSGQYDALAAHEMFGGKSFTCVSLPNGDKGVLNVFKGNIRYLDSFEEVYLCFDSDESGQQWAKEVLKLYPSAKNVNMVSRFKDANECLLGGGKEWFISLVWAAQRQTPEYINDGVEDALKVLQLKHTGFVSTGIAELDKRMDGGFRPGNLVVLMSATGTGKTSMVLGIVASYLQQGKKVLFSATEQRRGIVKNQLVEAMYGVNPETIPTEEARVLLNSVKDSFHFFDPQERMSDEEFKRSIRAVTLDIGYDLFVLDTVSNDIAKGLEDIGSRCRVVNDLICELPLAAVLVTHVSRTSQEKDKDGNEAIPDIIGAFGSSVVERLAHLFIGLRRLRGGRTEAHILKARGFRNAKLEVPIPLSFDAKRLTYQDSNPRASDDNLRLGASVPQPNTAILSEGTIKNKGDINHDGIDIRDSGDRGISSGLVSTEFDDLKGVGYVGISGVSGTDGIFDTPLHENLHYLGEKTDDCDSVFLDCGDAVDFAGNQANVRRETETEQRTEERPKGEEVDPYPYYPSVPYPESMSQQTRDRLDRIKSTVGERREQLKVIPGVGGYTPATWSLEQVSAHLESVPKIHPIGEEFRAQGMMTPFEATKTKDGYPILAARGYKKAAGKLRREECAGSPLVKTLEEWMDYAEAQGHPLSRYKRGALRQSVREEVRGKQPTSAAQPGDAVQCEENGEVQTGLYLDSTKRGALGDRDQSGERFSLACKVAEGAGAESRTEGEVPARATTRRENPWKRKPSTQSVGKKEWGKRDSGGGFQAVDSRKKW